ncbi:hypothetical protein [Calycomorphotria hydatis]|uniref:Uncharacterized protein n=1 Tax=Calycomorphotria hydatis TaxID=2528027 RepID=A0A517TBR4_9PLAN|nr:hypothetical protein [Calycomorphotria hydatis]QDT65811.1 hypothetical protein V22_30730 [Calycomorphotria hydatis]
MKHFRNYAPFALAVILTVACANVGLCLEGDAVSLPAFVGDANVTGNGDAAAGYLGTISGKGVAIMFALFVIGLGARWLKTYSKRGA